MGQILAVTAPGCARYAMGEIALSGYSQQELGTAWLLAGNPRGSWSGIDGRNEPCFARIILDSPDELRCSGPAETAQSLCDYFCRSVRGERIEGAWSVLVAGLGESGPGPEIRVAEEFCLRLRTVMSRVAKCAVVESWPVPGAHRGLFAFRADPDRVFVSLRCWTGGQCRMRTVDGAPSRSYLKVEEAYRVMGRAPAGGETVVDLGAAPGGWSFSAAQRGARVTAVDNGPLKGGARDNPLIRHVRHDAFAYDPETPVDWLFCDMVEDPYRVLDLVKKWVARERCGGFVVNLKFGRANPLDLLQAVNASVARGQLPKNLIARHLYHDREEITVMGCGARCPSM